MHPYAINKSRTQVAAYLMLASVFISSGLNRLAPEALSYLPLSFEIGSVSSLVVFSGLYVAFDKCLWKYRPFSYVAGIPDISGSWVGVLESSHHEERSDGGDADVSDDGEDHTDASLRPTFRIEQTWTEIEVVGEFARSRSESRTASFITKKGQPELVFTYGNDPRGSDNDQAPQHGGTNKLRYAENGGDDERLIGEYYTDQHRNNHGTVELKPSEQDTD